MPGPLDSTGGQCCFFYPWIRCPGWEKVGISLYLIPKGFCNFLHDIKGTVSRDGFGFDDVYGDATNFYIF